MASFPDHMNPAESRIINKAISAILRAGYFVRVYDGEEYATNFTQDRSLIQRETAATCETVFRLFYRTPTGNFVYRGSVLFIHGNGEDVLSDLSAPDQSALDQLETLLKGVAQ